MTEAYIRKLERDLIIAIRFRESAELLCHRLEVERDPDPQLADWAAQLVDQYLSIVPGRPDRMLAAPCFWTPEFFLEEAA